MKLSIQDAELFFKLMLSLQNYVNLKWGILPGVTTVDEYQQFPSKEKIKVRDKLYENIELIDAYFEENPQDFSGEELEIIRGWKEFCSGDFFVERLLKKHAIFISSDE
jgi:hypothetical protein